MEDRRAKQNRLETVIENAWEGWYEANYEGYRKIAAQYKKQAKALEKEYNSFMRRGK